MTKAELMYLHASIDFAAGGICYSMGNAKWGLLLVGASLVSTAIATFLTVYPPKRYAAYLRRKR